MRELIEMRYEFEEPFTVDSSRITEGLGATATPVEEALRHTLDSYRAQGKAQGKAQGVRQSGTDSGRWSPHP
ncbi:hypothetical protein QMK19_16460 [Streptomyces sp. H10-C2]|uniref:hypothetical protein n=1 Tax=unclassified Streptomyces TaxID=2593676 RepID=UPI0024B912A5|nr:MULTISPECIES: hypothetical protein [unclassified Streptomyces]MDJ0344743.1 hypothetical protein [Streptomyces sp. PH10-H1]MDJ0371234.1 hypothetical protein [Streptomyces sp. H10-C2]